MKKLLLCIMLAFSSIVYLPMADTSLDNPIVEVQAATIKLNKTSVSLKKGKTVTLKVSGTKKKVTWSSSKKSVASVTSKGKVTAKKKGTAYIYAKVSGKTLKCKVKVTTTNTVSSQVYITKYGKKYHRKSNCGNSKYVTKVSLTYAKNNGYTACKKCY